MKRRTALLGLMLALAMVVSSFQMVFAGEMPVGKPTDVTRTDCNAFRSVNSVTNEVQAEKLAKDLSDQVAAGGYKLMDTATLKQKLDNGDEILVIDVMPNGWWLNRHIPGAKNCVIGGDPGVGPEFLISTDEGKALIDIVTDKYKTKKVVNKTYYWNAKTKKWTTKKPAKKYWKNCTKKSDKHYKQKKYSTYKQVPVKNKPVVVYCGFTKCQRSHQAAMYLVSKGYTNVYRYAGGITAWVDSDFDIEGNDVADVAVE